MSNYSKISVPAEARVELHDVLHLTGAEISINNLPEGAQVPFVHSHKQNEEIYVLQLTHHAVVNISFATLSF